PGSTSSSDFPTQGAFQTAFGGGPYDGFVTHLDPAGQLVYSTYLGGSGSDAGTGIAVDQNGQAFVTGTTGSRDLPTQSAFQPAFGGVSNAFVTALDTTGQPLYSTYLGGSLTDAGHGIAVDSHDHVYVTGTTSSANFPTQNAGQSNLTGF